MNMRTTKLKKKHTIAPNNYILHCKSNKIIQGLYAKNHKTLIKEIKDKLDN